MPEKIRSELFHKAGDFRKEFGEHLKIVWDYPTTKQKVILKHLLGMLGAITEREAMVARERFVMEIDGDPQDAVKAMQVIQTIAALWSPIRDTAEVALEDIQGLHVLPTDAASRKRAVDFCSALFKLLEKDGDRRLRRATAGKALKNLKSLESTIDCRLIIDSEFDWRDDDPADYKPSCRGTVPVAILTLGLHGEDPIVFQCDGDDLEMLVRQLQATKKELKLAGTTCHKRR
jgi:hypothetical protein